MRGRLQADAGGKKAPSQIPRLCQRRLKKSPRKRCFRGDLRMKNRILQLRVGAGDLGAGAGVVVGKLEVCCERAAAGHVLDVRKQERRDCLAVDMLGVCLCDCLIDDLVHVIGVHRILLGDGVADDGAALETHVPLGLHD